MNRSGGGRGAGTDGGVQWPKALVLIVVLVVIGVVILYETGRSGPTNLETAGPAHHGGTSTTTSTVPAPVTTTTVVAASQVKVQVLNGVLTGALASEWSTKLKSRFGYVTEPPDNATTKVPTSIIYVLTPGYQAEADQLATAVGLTASAVYPTAPPPATAPIPATERATANLVLVIGPDLASSA